MTPSADLLYTLACDFLSSHLTVYYVLDDEFINEGGKRVTRWLHEAEGLTRWLHEEQDRTQYEYLKLAGEHIVDSYLERASEKLIAASKHLAAESEHLPRHMWFYFLYCRWFLYAMEAFDGLVRHGPIADTVNYQIYLENLSKFETVSSTFKREYPDFDSMDVDSQTRAKLEGLLDSYARQLTDLWEQALADAYRSETES